MFGSVLCSVLAVMTLVLTLQCKKPRHSCPWFCWRRFGVKQWATSAAWRRTTAGFSKDRGRLCELLDRLESFTSPILQIRGKSWGLSKPTIHPVYKCLQAVFQRIRFECRFRRNFTVLFSTINFNTATMLCFFNLPTVLIMRVTNNDFIIET